MRPLLISYNNGANNQSPSYNGLDINELDFGLLADDKKSSF